VLQAKPPAHWQGACKLPSGPFRPGRGHIGVAIGCAWLVKRQADIEKIDFNQK
jgi:hypothetical protein